MLGVDHSVSQTLIADRSQRRIESALKIERNIRNAYREVFRMKCLIVFSLLTLGCAVAQDFNDGRYYPELLRSKFDDGQYRPDNGGAYRPGSAGSFVQRGSGGFGNRRGSSGFSSANSANRFGSANGNRFVNSAQDKFVPVFAQAPTAVFAPVSSGFGASSNNRGFGSSGGSSASRGSQDGVKEDTRELNEDGFFYRFLTENNIEVAQTGRIENRGSDNEVLRTKGFYEFVGDDGVRYRVDYIADENGFQPTGEHLPTPPPIPEEIVRSLQLLSQG
ncbi:larval cuticle protein LCP-30 isoform X2 [Aedes aegypti]|uniref:larval cuticle protein LCP-30 isoform X2 n=1 Tax=Aedes aegypti TaxID=7159 RepID=UPI000B76E941|nr:larval cuticle protein LCP-30 isoform X2 [Aedes aegypti]